jgi:hypothetical protein
MIPEACPVLLLVVTLVLLLELVIRVGSTGSVHLGFCCRLVYFIHTNAGNGV